MYFVSIKKKAIPANFVGKSDIPNDKQHWIISTKQVSLCLHPTNS